MTDFSKSYSSLWRLYRVDPYSWADSSIVGGIRQATITSSMGDMIESGTFSIDTEIGSEFEEGYHRLVMYATQDGATERHEIATLYCTSTNGTTNKGVDVKTIAGRSVLYPASKTCIDAGLNVAAGENGLTFAAELLRDTISAPVEAMGGFTLADHFVFDLGAKVLTVVWTLLNSAGYCMQISGNGTVTLLPMPTEPVVSIGSDGDGILMPEESYELDWSSVPNRYIATDGTSVGVAVNDDPTSRISTVSRGFVVDIDSGIDSSPLLVNGEGLDDYCVRRLHEMSVAYDSRSYAREYIPNVHPYSIVRRSTAKGTVDSRVENQSLACGAGITVTESARIEVNGWQ